MSGLNRLRRRAAARVGLAAALGAGAAGGVYVYIVWQVVQGRLTTGDLVVYGGAAALLQRQFVGLGTDLSFLPRYYGTYLPSLFRVLDAPPDLPAPASPRPAPRLIREGIVFEDVHFAYRGGERPILRGVSFRTRPGEGLALVGHNGTGKTPSSSCCCACTTQPAGASCLTAWTCGTTTSTTCAGRWV